MKFPPRVSMGYRKGSTRPFVLTAPAMDCENHTYLSEAEHSALLAEAASQARVEAFEEAGEYVRDCGDDASPVLGSWFADKAEAARALSTTAAEEKK